MSISVMNRSCKLCFVVVSFSVKRCCI